MSSNVGEGGAFVRTRAGLDAPDVQLIFGALMLHEEFLARCSTRPTASALRW